MDYQVVATVPNKACNLLKRIPLKLDCGIVISQLEPEHYGVLCRYDDPGMEAITAHHKGVTASFKNEYLKDKAYSDILTCLCFALNFFSEKGFVTFHRVYKVTNVRRVVAKEKLFNPCDPFPSSAGSNFSMRNDVSIKQFEDLFLGAVAALGKEKSMRVTYDRFVLAQSRTDLQSKVIDSERPPTAIKKLYKV